MPCGWLPGNPDMLTNIDHALKILLIAGTVANVLFIVFLISFLMLYRKKQLSYFQEKVSLKAQYEQEILASQVEVQNATLQHIGRELHDNIGQLLTVARINLTIVEESNKPFDNQEYIQQASELIDQSIIGLRALTRSLDGEFIADFGLSESIAQELLRIRRTRKFETEIKLVGEAYSLGFQREIVLFRIVQEALTNALKHSGATQLVASLQFEPTLFTLTLADNGKGFDYGTISEKPVDQAGAGLRNMERRASLIGGVCTLISAPGQGTSVTITVPYTSSD